MGFGLWLCCSPQRGVDHVVCFFYIFIENVGQKLFPELLAYSEVEDPWNKN